jgi:oligopeptide transport system substrate-binding protein
MSKKLFAIASLLIVASMILGACAPAAQPATVVVTKEVEKVVTKEVEKVVTVEVAAATAVPEAKTPLLRMNLGTYPDKIDPQKSSFVNEIATLKLVYEGLTKQNGKLETVPGAAEKWEYNADSTELTFTLKKDLKYSDGTPLNAKRFEYSLLRNIDPETAGEYASITNEILGAPEWQAADVTAADYDRQKFVDAVGVKALDASGQPCKDYEQADCLTLKLTLSKPAPYFHTIAGIWVGFPAKQELIEEGGENWWNSSKYQIGNGPFIMDVVEPFVRQHFTPNPNYVSDKPTYDFEFRYIVDTAVSFEAYKNNELDIVFSAGEDFDAIKADPDLTAQHLIYPGACTTVLKYGLDGVYTDPNGKKFESIFKDPKVREAFQFAFNAQGWADDVDSGLSSPTWTWIPPGFPGYDAEDKTLGYDVERAKKALADSTYKGPEALNALGLKLTFGDSPRNRQRSEWLVNNYKQNLGVDIALDPIEATTFTAITKDPKTFPLLARQGWCADYPDPQNWLSVYWKSDTSFAARQGYKNEEFDKLVAQADVEGDPAKRAELYKQAQRVLTADIPSAFGYNSLNHYLVKPWVKGIVTTPQDSDWPGSFEVAKITLDTAMMPK